MDERSQAGSPAKVICYKKVYKAPQHMGAKWWCTKSTAEGMMPWGRLCQAKPIEPPNKCQNISFSVYEAGIIPMKKWKILSNKCSSKLPHRRFSYLPRILGHS